MNQTKFILSEKEIPTKYYNILPDLPKPLPPLLHPATTEPTITITTQEAEPIPSPGRQPLPLLEHTRSGHAGLSLPLMLMMPPILSIMMEAIRLFR